MRALARFTTGILRVESPPISRVEILRNRENRSASLRVRVRFAFDAVRVVSNGGRTVRLELKTGSNPQIPADSRSSSPSFTSISGIEAQNVSRVEQTTVSVYEFDIARSIPDGAIQSLKSGNPIEYQYLLAVPAMSSLSTKAAVSVSDRDYLLGVLEEGRDPATLQETFPVRDPSKKSSESSTRSESFYTRPVSLTSSYKKMKIYSTYQVFEQDVEMSLEDFLSSSVYEFSYIDYTGTPIEFVEVKVQGSSIYEEMKKLQYSSPSKITEMNDFDSSNPQVLRYVRDIVSINSLISTEFKNLENYNGDRRPKVIRTHYGLSGSDRQSIKFKSEVIGLPSKRSRVAKNPNSTKPAVIPFYIDNTAGPLQVMIKSLPPRAMRVSVHVRNVTKGENSFSELVSQRVTTELLNRVQITLPEKDCVYELRVSSTDKKQRTIHSNNSVVYSNLEPYKNAFINVSKPSLIGDQKVKFKINADFSDAGRQDLSNLINIINASGVSSTTLSADGYVSDPNLYSDVFSCRIEKIDLETGEQTYTKELAIGSQGVDFVDSVRSSKGVVYTFSLGMRSPSSLVPQQSFYKFGTFGGRYLRSLPSDSSASFDQKSGAPFENIDSGIKRVVEVPTTTLRGSVNAITLSRTMRDTTLIEWGYLGDLTEVDHFQVFGSADGVECLLGCSFRSLAFEDSELHDRVGVVTYRVRPVYVSLEPGESFTITAYKRQTLPSLLLPDFVNGQTWMEPVRSVNANVTVDTAESYSQQYVDYFSTDITKRERRSTSTQAAGSLRRMQASSGLVSLARETRSPPRLTFNPAPIAELQQLITPINSFMLSAIVESQGSSPAQQESSISAESSVRTASEAIRETQQIAYSRNLR